MKLLLEGKNETCARACDAEEAFAALEAPLALYVALSLTHRAVLGELGAQLSAVAAVGHRVGQHITRYVHLGHSRAVSATVGVKLSG